MTRVTTAAGVMLLRTAEGQQPYGDWHFTKIMMLLSARFKLRMPRKTQSEYLSQLALSLITLRQQNNCNLIMFILDETMH